MSWDSDGCLSYPSEECGNHIKVDPGDIGLSHIITHQVAASATNLSSNQQTETRSVLSAQPADTAQASPSTSTSASINQSHEQWRIPPPSSTSSPPELISIEEIPIKERKTISTKIASVINQLKKVDKTSNLAMKQSRLSNQPSYDNEALKLLYDISNSNTFLNENKHMFKCSVLPQFKCKLCDDYIMFDPDQQKLINNFEAHLKTHYSNTTEISPSLLTDLLYCLPSPFRNTQCLYILPNGLLKCSICDCKLPGTAQDICEHLTSNNHNFLSKTAISVPTKCEFVKVLFQLGNESGICLTCFSSVNISDMINHNHPSLKKQGLDETYVKDVLPLKIRNFGCFLMDQGKLVCNICDREMVAIPYLLYEHVLAKSHNKKLYRKLSKKLSNQQQYTKAKQMFVATSTNTVCCVFCGLEMQVSEIKVHLSTESYCYEKLSLNYVLGKLPVEYHRNTSFYPQKGGQVKCKLCEQDVPSSAIHLHHHLLTPTHSNNVVKQNINTLNFGVKQVKFVAQFSKNEVLCLICNTKINPAEIGSHEHLLGNISTVKQNHAVIDSFVNTLKNVRCLIQTDDLKVFCSICDCNVPFPIGNLLEHILGEPHNTSLYNLYGVDGKSLDEMKALKRFIYCDKNEVLCLDCNVKFPFSDVAIFNHQKQPNSSTSETLDKLKDIPCLFLDAPTWFPYSNCCRLCDRSVISSLDCKVLDPNSIFCRICDCSVPWSVRNVLEHLLSKPHNQDISNHPETFKCFIQVGINKVVCLNCNYFMSAEPSALNKHALSTIHKDATPDLSNIISQQLKCNKCLIKTVDDKITCIICQCTMSAELKIIQNHLSSTNHLTNVRSNTSIIDSIGISASNLLNIGITDRTIDSFLDVLKHTRCLILTNDNRAVCSICSCDVPLTISNLLEHILGQIHNKNIATGIGMTNLNFYQKKSQLQHFILCDKDVLLCLDCNTKFPLDLDTILNHRKQSHSTSSDTLNKFKDIPCLVPYEKNSLFCSICNCMVPWSVRNILEHLLGWYHNKKISNGMSTANKSSYFVQVNRGEALCLNCNCKMSASIEVLNTHISEYHNNNGVLNFPRVISQQFQNNQFLIKTVDNQVTCLLCHCTFPADTESVKNHLSETTHINNLSFDASTFLSDEFADVKCFLKTDVAQVMCLVCNCFVPLSSVNLSEHLLGGRHNKLAVQR